MDRKDSKISSAEGGERNFIQNLNKCSGKRHKKGVHNTRDTRIQSAYYTYIYYYYYNGLTPIGGSVQKRSLSVAPAADEFTRDGFTHRTSDERFFFFFFVFRIALVSSSRRRLPTERKRKQTLCLLLRGDVPDFIGDGDCFDAATRVTRAAAFPPRSAPGAIVARDFPRA